MPPTKEATHQKWQRAYEDAVDSDQWGQVNIAMYRLDIAFLPGHLKLQLTRDLSATAEGGSSRGV